MHVTEIVDGAASKTIHLCKNCVPTEGSHPGGMDPMQIQAFSFDGKKCGFCGKGVFCGMMLTTGGMCYWCFDCDKEIGAIFSEIVAAERPDLLAASEEKSSFSAMFSDADLQAWAVSAHERARQILKDRRQQDGRGTTT